MMIGGDATETGTPAAEDARLGKRRTGKRQRRGGHGKTAAMALVCGRKKGWAWNGGHREQRRRSGGAALAAWWFAGDEIDAAAAVGTGLGSAINVV